MIDRSIFDLDARTAPCALARTRSKWAVAVAFDLLRAGGTARAAGGCVRPPPPNVLKYAQLFGPTPGYYAISVSYLRGARLPVSNGRWGRDLVAPGDFTYFQTLRPIARAGYSILIYHLDLEQSNALRRALDVPVLDPGVPPPS